MKIQLPQDVDYIINELGINGYEAFAVGGCVRDSILGREPKDWDITTKATPLEVKKIFRRTIDTGIQHGTVTVMFDKAGYEVTTYRVDGEYEDSRHPKSVSFTKDLVEDLKRRDFTINAMAYNKDKGLVDAFHGLSDIKEGVIRCVGSADNRFEEDALRILRAIRFSAQLGFGIEEDTLEAVREKAPNLKAISAERIREELNKLLISPHPEQLLLAYETGITNVIFPEFDKMMETTQNNYYHIYSVGEHTIKTVQSLSVNKDALLNEMAGGFNNVSFSSKEHSILCWTMLLHDVGKPECKTTNTTGDHFYGHGKIGAGIARDILRRLKFDNETIDTVFRLILWHDYRFTLTPSAMRKAVNKIGEDIMDLLFEVQKADILGKNPEVFQDKFNTLTKAMLLFHDIRDKKECISLKTLQMNGRDLIALGFVPGTVLGKTLSKLLNKVLEDPKLNEKGILRELALELLKENA
ncbi:MAG: CCA tRNA nucleotidyltransferase [Anaerocolumna sp.]